MRNIHLILILFFIAGTFFSQSDSSKVTIRVLSNELDSLENIYIAGNKSQLGNWHPDYVKLEKKNNYWEKTFTFELNTSLEFKFTKGSWDAEALNNEGMIPRNYIVELSQDTVLIFTINNWNDGKSSVPVEGQITGNVVYHRQMVGDSLMPRDIIVWLPPNYEKNIMENYPVLYMHDGQNIFDPNTSYSKVDWQIDEAADSLIRKNEIKPMIIVGISSTRQRTLEYSPGPTNKNYMHFLVEKLKPFIDSTYRTIPERENTFVGGSSSGGTISFLLLWEYSNIFSRAACFSPAFVTEDFNLVEQFENYKLSAPVELYIYNGGIGIETQLQIGIDLMLKKLEEKGFREGENYRYLRDINVEHNESAWAEKVPSMLRQFFAKSH